MVINHNETSRKNHDLQLGFRKTEMCGQAVYCSDHAGSDIAYLCRQLAAGAQLGATSERSFSALRRLKNYLRSTMNQARLSQIVLLHIHKHLTEQRDLNSILRDFLSKTSDRKKMFGKV
ncbi:hypothetical protein FOCC_FOCC007739 [Frankliniella occidentalis]|nr:hypothetical protein FOCC_FOCC007739 [Frankliniella occidentalis]